MLKELSEEICKKLEGFPTDQSIKFLETMLMLVNENGQREQLSQVHKTLLEIDACDRCRIALTCETRIKKAN